MKNLSYFSAFFSGLKTFCVVILMITYLLVTFSVIMCSGIIIASVFIFIGLSGYIAANYTLAQGLSKDLSTAIAVFEILLHGSLVFVPGYLYGKKFVDWWGSLFDKIEDL